MSLQEKVLKLKMDAVVAARHAAFWQRAIDTHGAEKAAAFYTHLGLNHLEKKSIEWEGLTLSREPKEHEKIAIKGVHGAQESAKVQVLKILMEARTELISAGLKGIKKLPASQYHSLVLSVSPDIRSSLRDRLIKVYQKGRRLLDAELADQRLLAGKSTPKEYLAMKADDAGEFDDLDLLTDLTTSRVSNDLAARIVSAAARYTLLGLSGKDLWEAVEKEVGDGSTGWLERAATGVANKTINEGRSDEAQSRKDEWERIEYSAIMDVPNTCEACAADDGTTSVDGSDLTPVPSPYCLGGDWCRCFWVYISQ